MTKASHSHLSSLFKKYLMAVTGLILVGFVLFHMLGNLQLFGGPDMLNHYAHFLKSLPKSVLWGGRLFLLTTAALHVWMGVTLAKENYQARPSQYAVKHPNSASLTSRTMALTGSILLFFIIFHLLHFTIRWIHPEFNGPLFKTVLNNEVVDDVYMMVVYGFSIEWVAIFYVISMGLLCMHLSHGVSSMFQSLGIRNEAWRYRFKAFAIIYGWVIFIGFISNPVAVQISKYTGYEMLPVNQILIAIQNAHILGLQ